MIYGRDRQGYFELVQMQMVMSGNPVPVCMVDSGGGKLLSLVV